MAKEKDIDRLFQDKLTDHTVQPSVLAWDKLEGRLSRKKKSGALWMRIAAAILLIGGLSVLIWLGVENTRQELDILADQEPAQEYRALDSPVLPENTPPAQVQAEAEKEEATKRESPQAPDKRMSPKTTGKRAVATILSEEPNQAAKENIILPEFTAIELPPLNQELLAVESSLVAFDGREEEEVAYKVTIISNGLRGKPEKEGLVGEIENKIDKIGGLIGKVDQGFADLQDAKNNLFTSITARK